MEQKMIQDSLFNPLELSGYRSLNDLIKIGINRTAFGVTKINLRKGTLGVLNCLLYGIHNLNLESFLIIPAIQNPGEILLKCLAANGLKKGNAHLQNPDIPDDFLEFMDYLDEYSKNNRNFADFAGNFEDYFDIEQETRFGLLNEDYQKRFVKLVKLTKRKISNNENEYIYDFYDPNWGGGRDKEKCIGAIYEKLDDLNKKAKQI